VCARAMSLGRYVDLLRPEFAAYRLPFVPLPLWAIWLAALLFGGPVELDLLRAVHGKARAAAHARKPGFPKSNGHRGWLFLGSCQSNVCSRHSPKHAMLLLLCWVVSDLQAPLPRAKGQFSAASSTEGCPAATAAAAGAPACAQRGRARARPAPRKAAPPGPRRRARGRQVPQFDCSKARRELGLDFIDVRRTAQARGLRARAPARMHAPRRSAHGARPLEGMGRRCPG
jgi:hypothetical protein